MKKVVENVREVSAKDSKVKFNVATASLFANGIEIIDLDIDAAKEYANQLRSLREKFSEKFVFSSARILSLIGGCVENNF